VIYPSYLIDEDTFCISDCHFGHKKVETHFEPVRVEIAKEAGYDNAEELIIQRINEAAGPEETLLVLGDFAFKAIEHYSSRLVAKHKIIILGNHDRKAPLYKNYGWHVFDGVHLHISDHFNPFVSTYRDVTLMSGLVKPVMGVNILFSHYPVFDDNKYDRANKRIAERSEILEQMYEKFGCDLNIHGHVHSATTAFDKCFNVSCEPLKFRPLRIREILERMWYIW